MAILIDMFIHGELLPFVISSSQLCVFAFTVLSHCEELHLAAGIPADGFFQEDLYEPGLIHREKEREREREREREIESLLVCYCINFWSSIILCCLMKCVLFPRVCTCMLLFIGLRNNILYSITAIF